MAEIPLHDMGPSLKLISLQILAREFQVSKEIFEGFLERIGVPTMEWLDGSKYVSQFALESALFGLLRVGEPSWRAEFGRTPPKPGRLMRWEMGLAALAYGAMSREVLKMRLAAVAKMFTNRRRKPNKKTIDRTATSP